MLLAAGLILIFSYGRAFVAGRRHLALSFLEGRVIALDAGHGGPDPGTVGGRGTLEKEVVLSIALMLRDHLTDAGARVVMTRTTDTDLSGMDSGPLSERKRKDMAARVRLINESGASALVSVHANSIGSSHWSGGQTFYLETSPPNSRRLAESIQRELIDITGETRRSVNTHIQHRLLSEAVMPAVTVEVGFLSNPREEGLLMRRDYQERVAWALFVGIARYFAEVSRPHPKMPAPPAAILPAPAGLPPTPDQGGEVPPRPVSRSHKGKPEDDAARGVHDRAARLSRFHEFQGLPLKGRKSRKPAEETRA